MSDIDPSNAQGSKSRILDLPPRDMRSRPASPPVTFNKQELSAILTVYGRMVAAGEWRDYALDFGKESAVFSVFQRTSENPLLRIEKVPHLARKQGAYAVVLGTGVIVKRGHDLARVLAVFDKKLRLVP